MHLVSVFIFLREKFSSSKTGKWKKFLEKHIAPDKALMKPLHLQISTSVAFIAIS